MRFPLSVLRLVGRQRLINRGKVGFLHRLAAPEKLRPQRFTTNFYGLRYSGDVSNWIDWNVFFVGAYSPHELAILADAAQAIRRERGFVHYVDVGANVGHHSLFMSRHADQVTAIEPFSRVAAEIAIKVAENGLTNLRVLPFALGEHDHEIDIHLLDDANLGTATLTDEREGRTGRTAVGVAKVKRGDDLFVAEGMPRVDILKVDVEGFESAALRGLQQRILQDRPVILIELSGRDLSGFGSLDAFRAALYPDHELYAVTERKGAYRLSPLKVATDEVLCIPRELSLPHNSRDR